MAHLSLYLPPFAGDYSGACSVLFGLDCLTVIVDAGCCARNYVEYDETRWEGSRKAAFSAQLRTMDALMGDDSRIVEETASLARETGASCVALVGTPVPALVGMDLGGMAAEVEASCGIPAVGVSTTGFEAYDVGASQALTALLRAFCGDRPRTAVRRGSRPSVNVLGATPQDFMTAAALQELEDGLREAGLSIGFSTAGAYGLDDVRAAGSADASVVVSASGLAAARWLEDRRGVPYVVCRPWTAEDFVRLAVVVEKPAQGARAGEKGAFPPAVAAPSAARATALPAGANGAMASGGAGFASVLLVGDQVAMGSLRPHVRRMLRQAGFAGTVSTASFFSWDGGLAEPGDVPLADEAALEDWVRAHSDAAVIGDPLLRRIPALQDVAFFGLPHEAVSSTLFQDFGACKSAQQAVAELAGFFADLRGRRRWFS